jgi:O-acetyl-ADP-ribose deacetylase (regulator of RNase III)
MNYRVIKGDITKIRADAIVNAANSSLLGGSGVDGAIHRAAGSALLEECQKIRNTRGSCKTGEVAVTAAGNLPAKYVIHAVGPVWNDGHNNEVRLLESCYLNAVKEAEKRNLTSIAFPNISTGIYGFPKELAAKAVFKVLSLHFSNPNHSSLKEVIFACFGDEDYSIYSNLFLLVE